jgi:hypothetical protein
LGAGYGTLASNGGVILLVSYLFTTVLFPDYLAELRTIQEACFRPRKTPVEITAGLIH